MTNADKQIFAEALRGLAAACHIPQYRCQIFDALGVENDVYAVGEDACKPLQPFPYTGDGRCGPGGAAALLRSMAMLARNTPSKDFAKAMRSAASLTFDTDEEFKKMFNLASDGASRLLTSM